MQARKAFVQISFTVEVPEGTEEAQEAFLDNQTMRLTLHLGDGTVLTEHYVEETAWDEEPEQDVDEEWLEKCRRLTHIDDVMGAYVSDADSN